MTVFLIYLPVSPGAQKIGVDDYFAQGHSVSDLVSLASPELRPLPAGNGAEGDYRATAGGLILFREKKDDVEMVPLTNFTAEITSDVIEDDGAEQRRHFELEVQLNEKAFHFKVPSSEFPLMNWPLQHIGARAVVYPGQSIKDHARAAIQLLSGGIAEDRVYTHTGWRKTEDEWVYLHSAGAIGENGQVPDVAVKLPDRLTGIALPELPSGEDIHKAIRASLVILDVTSDIISVPIYGALWRAVLGNADFSVHLCGPTGAGKSELAALAQQHFGAGLDSRHLPADWSSTGNAIEGLAFAAKDVLLVVDDYAPTGTLTGGQRLQRDADRVFRAQGNRSGRQRMRADATLRPDKSPRGIILSTGEDVPSGQSLRARVVILELPKEGPGSLDWDKLTQCQRDAAQGLYSQAMAAFIEWLAPKYEAIHKELRIRVASFRKQVYESGQHRRTPDIIANLALGLQYFVDFARESGAISEGQASILWSRCWTALTSQAQAQKAEQSENEPTQRFIELLTAALADGRAHVAGPDGGAPVTPQAWGWRQTKIGNSQWERTEWRSIGERVGWVDKDDLYLQPDAVHAVVRRLGTENGNHLEVSLPTLKKRLRDRGLLASTETNRETISIRRTLEGTSRNVLHMKVDVLGISPDTKPDKPDIEAEHSSFSVDTSEANGGNVGFPERINADMRVGQHGDSGDTCGEFTETAQPDSDMEYGHMHTLAEDVGEI